MYSNRTNKEKAKRILSIEEMMFIRGGNEAPKKPKTPGEVIIQPFE